MSNRILKYELPLGTEFTLSLHKGSRILKVATVNEKAYLWALELQHTPITPVRFCAVLTGEEFELPSTYQYIDTFILCYGEFVGHLWVNTAVPVQVDGYITKLNQQSF